MGVWDDITDGISSKVDSLEKWIDNQVGDGKDPNDPSIVKAKAEAESAKQTAAQAKALDSPIAQKGAVTASELAPPPGVDPVTKKQIKKSDLENDHRVRIRAFPNTANEVYGDPNDVNVMFPLHPENQAYGTNGLMFPYTPVISWSQEVSYSTINVVHANQDYRAYSHTPALSLTISGPFTAQNPFEARYMLACMHFLRTTTKMRFGDNSNNRGLPPPVLILSGYGKYIFNDVPVIITGYSFEYKDNVDMVPVKIGNETVAWVPSMQNISVSLTVQTTPAKQRQFSWQDYRDGKLMGTEKKSKGWI